MVGSNRREFRSGRILNVFWTEPVGESGLALPPNYVITPIHAWDSLPSARTGREHSIAILGDSTATKIEARKKLKRRLEDFVRRAVSFSVSPSQYLPNRCDVLGFYKEILPDRACNAGQRGVKGKVNDQDVWAFCDTGAGQNVISLRHAIKMGLRVAKRPQLLRMGNSEHVISPGIVRYPWAFSDDPNNITTIDAYIIDNFKYDLLFGYLFLKFTHLMTKNAHRFVRGVFLSQNLWSLNLLGETSPRVQGILGNNIPMEGHPDIGSSRNVMDATWAKHMGFSIYSSPENCGMIVFPDNSTRATIGQVYTTITLPGGQVTPIVVEVLPDCYVPVVLGEDFVFDNNLFSNHAGAIYEAEGINSSHDLLCMDYQEQSWYVKLGSKAKILLQPKQKRNVEQVAKPLNDRAELERQYNWDSKHQYGQTATQLEWDTEQKRRASHESRQYSSW